MTAYALHGLTPKQEKTRFSEKPVQMGQHPAPISHSPTALQADLRGVYPEKQLCMLGHWGTCYSDRCSFLAEGLPRCMLRGPAPAVQKCTSWLVVSWNILGCPGAWWSDLTHTRGFWLGRGE